MEDIIIKNGFVVTMNAQRQMIPDGTVVIGDGSIVAVGKDSEISNKYRADKVIDARNHLVTPGFFNTHCHNSYYLTRGLFDDGGLLSEYAAKGWGYFGPDFETSFRKEDAKAGAMASFVEQIRSGSTCFADVGAFHDHMDGVAEAQIEVGMRGAICRSTRDTSTKAAPFPEDKLETTKDTLAKNENLYRDWHGKGDGLVNVWFPVRYANNCSDELLVKQKELADKYGVGVNSHADGSYEREPGSGEVQRFAKLGVLGRNVLMCHMGHITDQEIGMLKQTDSKICHCPLASAKALLGNIKPGRFIEMVKAGITISLGVDSVNEANNTDMVRVAYFTAMAHWELFPTTTNITAHKVMEMLTIDGAKALGMSEKLGSIEQGKTADVAIFSMRSIEWHPAVDPVCSLIYAASGSSTQTVIINGKPVMEGRKMVNVDEDEVARNVDNSAQAIRDKLGVKIPPLSW